MRGPDEEIEGFVACCPAEVDVLIVENGICTGLGDGEEDGDIVEAIVLPLVVAGDGGNDEQPGEGELCFLREFAAGGLPGGLESLDLPRDDAPTAFVDAAGSTEEDEVLVGVAALGGGASDVAVDDTDDGVARIGSHAEVMRRSDEVVRVSWCRRRRRR